MATRSTFLGPRVVTGSNVVGPYRIGRAAEGLQETAPHDRTVPETDTGGLVEHTQVFERTALKELGKLPA